MRRIEILAAALVVTALVTTGCNSGQGHAGDLVTFEDSASYAIGQGLGNSITSRQVPVIRAQVIQGLLDGLDDTGVLTREELLPLMQRLGEQSYNQRLEEEGGANLAAGEAYLAENAVREGVMTTESGLQYEILEEGDGDSPSATDRVRVHYHGTLIDGTVFDSSVERDESVVFQLNQVIPGWTEGVQLMTVGSKYRFVIPSELGYGEGGSGDIGPNSALVFEVELIGIE